MNRYEAKLASRIETTGAALCIGLDPRPELTEGGEKGVLDSLKKIVDETWSEAAAFKPNMAYFEAMGIPGLQILESLLEVMPKEVPVILDAKRSDIGETQKYYARSYFQHWGVDAVTLNPFLGYDSLEPFLDFEGKGIYLLAVTSNPGSADIERQKLANGRYVYQEVADFAIRAQKEERKTSVGLVVGLTNAGGEVLANIPEVPLLIPGLGAQGGSLDCLAHSGRKAPDVVNVSRGISYAEPEKSYGEKARQYRAQLAALRSS